jgi:hypothetical protein
MFVASVSNLLTGSGSRSNYRTAKHENTKTKKSRHCNDPFGWNKKGRFTYCLRTQAMDCIG